MNRKSFIKKMSRLMKLQMIAIIILIGVAGWGTYRMAESEMKTESNNFLTIFGNQLENRMESMDNILGIILEDTADLQQIQSNDYLTRHIASVGLQRKMSEILRVNTNAELLIVAESEYDICLMAGISVPFEQHNRLYEYTMSLAKEASAITGGWVTVWIGDEAYLCRNAVQNQRAVTVFLSIRTLLETVEIAEDSDKTFLWTDKEGKIYGMIGHPIDIEGERLYLDNLPKSHILLESYDLSKGKFQLNSYESKTVIYKQISYEMCIMFFAVLSLYLFTLYMVKSVRIGLIGPMNILTENMKKIQHGDYELRMMEEANNEEFYMMAVSFNQLLDEIIHLKIQYYEKRLELQEADQKYIRLQLRPHFFLNAMATVSGLGAKQKYKEIQSYIEALSKNIRYMFSSGMHTVPVKEEIRHVQNYLEMQELKYPNCVFSYIELPKELENWGIPQMIIHTLIENEYRYAVSRDSVLGVLIKISLVELENEKMLLIDVEDDGEGYPDEVMECINGDNGSPSTDGTRVGLWSLRRLMELMYERKGLFKIINIKPHGALSRIYIPAKIVHEVRNDKPIDNGIE